jgi:hypothetical protein
MKLVTVVFCTLIFGACSVEAHDCLSVVAEPVRALSVQIIRKLAKQHVESNSHYTAILWDFDVEDKPVQASKVAVAFLLLSNGDLDSDPIGALLWTEISANVVLRKLDEDGFSVVAAKAVPGCSKPLVEIRIDSNGFASVNGTKLGQIK